MLLESVILEVGQGTHDLKTHSSASDVVFTKHTRPLFSSGPRT